MARADDEGSLYDTSLFEAADLKLLETLQLVCPICQNVCRDPCEIQACGHLYCASCLSAHIQHRQGSHPGRPILCPLDNKQAIRPGGVLHPLLSYRRHIDGAAVRCPQRPACPWKGVHSELAVHLRTSCTETRLPCGQCAAVLRRGALERHRTEECPRRPQPCPYCRQPVPSDRRALHEDTQCSGLRVICPNVCSGGASILKRDLLQHRTVCPREPVRCPYFEVGCTASLERGHLQEHLDRCTQQHLAMSTRAADDRKPPLPQQPPQMPFNPNWPPVSGFRFGGSSGGCGGGGGHWTWSWDGSGMRVRVGTGPGAGGTMWTSTFGGGSGSGNGNGGGSGVQWHFSSGSGVGVRPTST